MRYLTFLCAAALACGLCTIRVWAADVPKHPEPTKEGLEFFEKNIRPVLADSCFKCHSAQAKADKKLKGKLVLDTWEGMAKGGESEEPAVVPGDPDKSALIKAIRYTDKETPDHDPLLMPPPKNGKSMKLPDEVIKNFEQWVKMGAPFPKGSAAGTKSAAADPDAKQHWAFQPPHEPAVPKVNDPERAKNEIDAFIQAKLDQKGIQPNPPADKQTLIRRATLDLTGLPPTPKEVEEFEKDTSPNAFEKVIDRLLSSAHYGERWGRYWLDVARYSDTKGYVFQEERRYPYAFTYRDWVVKALNDDLPYDQFLIQQIAADRLDLGTDKHPLAAMGFLTLGRRFLNSVPDIIDDRIDVVCRGTMALTVACARCHDHKFDPIPTADYYSLYGVFASSVEPRELPLIGGVESTSASLAFEKELQARQAAADSYLKEQSAKTLEQLRSAKSIADYLLAAETQKQIDVRGSGDATGISPLVLKRWKDLLARSLASNDSFFAPWRAYAKIPADHFSEQAPQVAATILDEADVAPPHPLLAKVLGGNAPASLHEAAQRYGEAIASCYSETPLPDAAAEQVRQLAFKNENAPLMIDPAQMTRVFRRDVREHLMGLRRKVDEWNVSNPAAPPRAMVVEDAPKPQDAPVLVRGNANNPGPIVPRHFLSLVSGPSPKPFTQGSGRLELAKAIASRDNPLTARVMVNRIWLHHFGAGIVRTPSDFGTRSDPPTHPELLDYLAVRFMNEGWSIKKMHKLIMLSSAYQQSSQDNPEARKIDPENLLVWKMNRRRLDFESMRDAMLAVSGKLDEQIGGRPVQITDASVTRRSIYGFIDRQNLPSMFRAFDFASPDTTSPQRFSTTVPQQALFFMNSPFSATQARRLLQRPEVATSDVQERVQAMYALLFSRPATSDEVSIAREFVESEQKDASADVKLSPWEKYAQVLMESNEFMFVD